MVDNIQEVTENSEIANAEASLDTAISTLKSSKIEKISEELNEPKRETLKLPKKEEEATDEDFDSREFDPKEFVEVDSPQIQKKINYLYKQVKGGEESKLALQDELRKLTNTLDQKEKNELYLFNELNQIKNRSNQDDENNILSNLRKQHKEALEVGDYDEASKINEKLLDFKTEQKLNAFITKQKVVEQPKRGQNYDPQDIADSNRITSEKDENGNLLRPWMQSNHPEFQDTIDLLAAVANKYLRKGQTPSFSTVMNEVDKMKGVDRRTQKETSLKHSLVLSGEPVLGASSENQENLSQLEKTYAAKLGLSEKDYAKVKKYSSSGPITVDIFRKKQ